MNKYEAVIIIDSNLTEENPKELINKFENYINEDGKLINTDDLGNKRLAYEIKGKREGHYVIYEFETEKENVYELERLFRITDEVLKFITMRKED